MVARVVHRAILRVGIFDTGKGKLMRLRQLLVFSFVFLLFVSGCTDSYWYKPGVSLDQALRDCRNCYHEDIAGQNWIQASIMLKDDMRDGGYRLVPESELPSGIRKSVFRIHMYWEELVAGQ